MPLSVAVSIYPLFSSFHLTYKDHLLSRDKLAQSVVGYVENKSNISRRELLESYDGCAHLRPLWDIIARKYDAVIVPSTVDEAPWGLAYTGDSVSTSRFLSNSLIPNAFWTILTYVLELLLNVDSPSCSLPSHSRLCWRKRPSSWSYHCRPTLP